MTTGDKAVGVAVCFMIGFFTFQQAYQSGYGTARAECKPAPKTMTQKQKVRWAVWSMRDRGVILK